MNLDVERTRRVLERQQAWQEAKRDRADTHGLHEISARLDWLAQQPAMPPDDPAAWLVYSIADTPPPHALAAPSGRITPEWTRPASLASAPRTRPWNTRRKHTFTDRQLEIAMRALEAATRS